MGGAGWKFPAPLAPVPVPKQRRAEATVNAAIDATVGLLEQFPVEEVTFRQIRERSGISQGSLTHHFGGREGLIAAAHVARYEHSCAADAVFLSRYSGALSITTPFATAMVDHISEMRSDERREVRWIRMSAIGAAFGNDDLASTLSVSYTALVDQLALYGEEAQRNGVTQPDADPRTIALLLSMHAQGLVLDDLIGQDVPEAAWHHMMVRFVASFLTPEGVRVLEAEADARFGGMWRAEVFGPPGRVPVEVADRLEALRGALRNSHVGVETDPAFGVAHMGDISKVRPLLEQAERMGRSTLQRAAVNDGAAESMMTLGMAALRQRGAAGIDVRALRETAGLSAASFHRTFGSREGYVRSLRVRLEIARAAHGTVRFAATIAAARRPADMRAALEASAVSVSDEVSRAAMWQRIETLAAAGTDEALRASLARVQRATRDLLIEQICFAQTRGLFDPELPARSVARLLDGAVFWHVFHGLDGRRPDRAQWLGTLRRIATLLSPDPAS